MSIMWKLNNTQIEKYNEYEQHWRNKIKDKSKEDALKELEESKFYIDMIDHWDIEDEMVEDILSDLIKELEV